jgi:hypothetical protein
VDKGSLLPEEYVESCESCGLQNLAVLLRYVNIYVAGRRDEESSDIAGRTRFGHANAPMDERGVGNLKTEASVISLKNTGESIHAKLALAPWYDNH